MQANVCVGAVARLVVAVLFMVVSGRGVAVDAEISANPIAIPDASQCNSVDVPEGSPLTPPGHWYSPDRVGQGWDVTHWAVPVNGGTHHETHVKMTWYTHKDRRPIWLESDILPVAGNRTWRSTVYKISLSGGQPNRSPVGEVSFRLMDDARVMAINWRRADLGNVVVPDCIFDVFRSADDPIDRGDPQRAVLGDSAPSMLSGVWEEVNNPSHRALHFQKGHTRDNGVLQDAELIFPLLFDSDGEPVWLYGQYGPSGAMPSDYTYGIAANAPGDPLNLVYVYLKYGTNGTSPPTHECTNIRTCVEWLRPPQSIPFRVRRVFVHDNNPVTPDTPPMGPAPAAIEIGLNDGQNFSIQLPNGSHELVGWVRPSDQVSGPTMQIRRVNAYSSVQVDRYQCQVGPPDNKCAIQVSWAAGTVPTASLWRYDVGTQTQVRISGEWAWRGQTDRISAGVYRYRIYEGLSSTGPILAETREVRAYGTIADDPIVPLPVPNHDPTVGGMPGTPGTSGGAAVYDIPIQVPPGRNGMTPELSLTYSSRAGNGIAGMGWSLSGLSSIHRCPKTVDQDEISTAVNYSIDDRLCLDGRRLMLTAESPHPYGQLGAIYRTEIDDFARVTQLGAPGSSIAAPATSTHFKVEHKSGLIDWYGYAPGNAGFGQDGGMQTPAGAAAPLTWARVRREDRSGNFIRYWYSINTAYTDQGEFLLAGITYTGHNATEGTRLIDFKYCNRNTGAGDPSVCTPLGGPGNDIGSSYLSGGLNLQTQRLARITTYAPGGVKVREYRLNYGAHSEHSRRSLLRTVQECGFSGASEYCKDVTTFGWQDAPPQYDFRTIDFAGLPLPNPIDPPGAVNPPGQGGSRKPPRLLSDTLRMLWQSRLSPSTGEFGNDVVVVPLSATVQNLVRDFRPFADVDGDGSLEWYARIKTGVNYQSYLVRMTADRQIAGVYNVPNIEAFYTGAHATMRPSDVNNDGRAELVGAANGRISFGFWNGTTHQLDRFVSSIPYSVDTTTDVRLHDFTGDGKTDVLLATTAAVVTSPSHGCPGDSRVLVLYRNTSADVATNQPQFSSVPQFVTCLARSNVAGLSVYENIEHVSDFDGNGLPDLFILGPFSSGSASGEELKRVVLAHHSGSGSVSFEARQPSQLGSGLGPDDLRRVPETIVRWADINGDGLDDLVVGHTSWNVRFNRGGMHGLDTAIGTGASDGLRIDAVTPEGGGQATLTQRYANLIQFSDIDGDGRADMLVPTGFALRMCSVSNYQNEGMTWNAWACPEHPTIDGEPLPNPFGAHLYTQWMYANGYGQADFSVYTMSALRIVQTGAHSVSASLIPSVQLASGGMGDLYGDGLVDQIVFAGCALAGANSCAVMPGSPAAMPNGDPTAPFALHANGKYYVSENQGVGFRGTDLPPRAPELMEIAVDGMGRETVWVYYPLSSSAGREPTMGAYYLPFYSVPARSTDAGYVDAKHFYFTSSMNAVETMVDATDWGVNFWTYSYTEAMYNNRGRGFQGFRSIVADVSYGGLLPNRTVSTFHQKFPLTGLLERVEERLAIDGGSFASGTFVSSVPPIESVDYLWLTLNTGNGRVHPYLKRSDKVINDFEAEGLPRPTHTVITQRVGSTSMMDHANCTNLHAQVDGIDCAGNVTQQTTTTTDAYATHTQMVTSVYEAHDAGINGNWWINRPIKTTQSSDVTWHIAPIPAGSTVQTLETNYTYGNHVNRRLPDWIQQVSLGDYHWRQTKYDYDAWGNVTSESLFGTYTTEANSLLGTRSYASSGGYFPTLLSNAYGHNTVSVFDARFGIATSVTDPNGLVTTVVPDAFGLPIQVTAPGTPVRHTGVQRCGGPYSCHGVDGARYRVVSVQDGTPTSITYHDTLHREVAKDVRSLYAQGTTVRVAKGYNPRGLLVQESVPYFTPGGSHYWITYGYDELGRVMMRTDPEPNGAGRETRYVYHGLTTTITAQAPSATHHTLVMTRTHNVAGQLLGTTDALGGSTDYRYDGQGHAIAIRDAGGATLTATYNALGERMSMNDPDRGAWTFQTTADGQPFMIADARPAGRHIAYDRLGRPTHEYEDRTGSSGWTLLNDWVWDGAKRGRLAEQRRYVHGTAQQLGTVQHKRTFEYDSLARPTLETVTIHEAVNADTAYNAGTNRHWLGAVFERRLQYDGYYGWAKSQYQGLQIGHGHATQLAAGSATQVWRRDPYGYVVKEGLPTGTSGDPTEYVLQAQDAWGRATQAQLGNGLRVGAVSDAATGQLASQCVGTAPGQCGTLSLSYAYDGWGNLVQQTQGTPLATESFGYDALHRLTSSQRNGAAAVTLGYHANGNLKYKSDYSQATDGAYGYGAKPHAVTSVQGVDGALRCFTYDGAGNQVSQRSGASCPSAPAVERLLTYEIGHRPETVTGGAAYGWQRLLFRYDGSGDRYLQRRQPHVQPELDLQVTVYPFPGYEVEVERVGNNWKPITGRQRLGDWGLWTGTASQGEVVYWHGDRLGSPAAKSGGAGTVLERHGFDAWGAGRNGSWQPNAGGRLNSQVSPRGFTGHEHLDEVGGLIHMNGRGYDPRLGRFLSVDPIIQFPANTQSLNPYSYLMNNPLSGTDPTGYAACGETVKDNDVCQVTVERRVTEVGSRISKVVSETYTVANNGGILYVTPGANRAAFDRIEAAMAGSKTMDGPSMGPVPMKVGERGSNPATCGRFGAGCQAEQYLYDPGEPSKAAQVFGDIVGSFRSPNGDGYRVNPFTGQPIANPQRIKEETVVNVLGLGVGVSSSVPRSVARKGMLFGQASVKSTFSNGLHSGRTIGEIAQALRSGLISADTLPINFIARDGQTIALNNRSLLALTRAGMQPTVTHNLTGNRAAEALLESHLRGGVPSNVIRVRGGPPGTSLVD